MFILFYGWIRCDGRDRKGKKGKKMINTLMIGKDKKKKKIKMSCKVI